MIKPVFRVLIADDDPSIRELLASLMRTLDFDVDLVTNGLDAVREFADSPYDLVITDYQIPGLDGYEVAEAIRGLHPTVPIVMVTGERLSGPHREALRAAGVERIIEKPFRIDEVLALREVITRTPAEICIKV